MSEEQAEYNVNKTIIRVAKNADNPFVMMDKRPLEKPYLSWKAKGLLAYLLSRPDDWTIRLGDLVKRSTDGEYATRQAIKELEEVGHITKIQERKDGQFAEVIYTVYEAPLRGNPQAENPQAENLALTNTNVTKKDNTNIIESANKKVDAILENERKTQEKEASNDTWSGRDKIPEPIRELLDVFVKMTGQRPAKKDLSDWLLTGQDWLDKGIVATDLVDAYKKSKDERGGFMVARPGSLTNVAGMFAGERRKKKTVRTGFEAALAWAQEAE